MKQYFIWVLSVVLVLLAQRVEAGAPKYGVSLNAAYKSFPIEYQEDPHDYYIDETESIQIKAVFPLLPGLKINSDGRFDLQVLNANAWTLLSFSSATAWPGKGSFESKSLTYYDYTYDFNLGVYLQTSIVTVSWNDTAVTILARFNPNSNPDLLELAHIADFSGFGDGTNASVKFTNDNLSCYCGYSDWTSGVKFQRSLHTTGSDVRTYKSLPNVWGDSELWESHVVKVSSASEIILPTLTIESPAAKLLVTHDDPLSIKGFATDPFGFSDIYAIVDYPDGQTSGAFPAEWDDNGGGTTPWTINGIIPFPGTNIITVLAETKDGNDLILTRNVFYKQSTILTVVTNGAGSISIAGVTNGSAFLNGTFEATLTPARGFVLADWAFYSSDSAAWAGWTYQTGSSTKAVFTVASTNRPIFVATFVPNPYAPLKGSYTGITTGHFTPDFIRYPDGVYRYAFSSDSAGRLDFTMTSNGVCSGKWTLRSNSVPFTAVAQMNTCYSMMDMPGIHDGFVLPDTNVVRLNTPWTNTAVSLILNLTNPSSFYGSLSPYISTANDNAYFNGGVLGNRNRITTTNVDRGTYNIGFLDDSENHGDRSFYSSAKMGYSFATATVDAKGTVTTKFYPADGVTQPFSMTSAQAEDGSFIFFAPLYSKGGFLTGWLSLTNGIIANRAPVDSSSTNDSTLEAVHWNKPAGKIGSYYPIGYTNYLDAYGTLYSKTKPRTNILDWKTGSISLLTASNSLAASSSLVFTNNKFITVSGSNHISLTLAPKTGLLSGSFRNGKKSTALSGAVIDNERVVGFFNDTNGATGTVELNGTATVDSEQP